MSVSTSTSVFQSLGIQKSGFEDDSTQAHGPNPRVETVSPPIVVNTWMPLTLRSLLYLRYTVV